MLLAASGLALAVAAPGRSAEGGGGFTPLPPDGPGAEGISDIFWLLVGIAALIVLVVFVPLLTFIVRYRGNGRGREVEGPQVRGNTQLEIGWTVGAVLLIAVIAVFTFYKLPGIVDPAAAGDTDELEVRVQGRQFYWQYEYPNGVIAINTLRLPVGRVTQFDVTAPDNDVIHSFWVPALAGKRDAIPGQETSFKVLPTRPGIHEVICGEFCGLQHAVMRGTVEVVPADEFDGWLEEQADAQEAGTSDLGEQIWEGACSRCHGPDYVGKIGPPLENSAAAADPEQVERILREGRNLMPAVGQDWSEEQMDALTEYLREEVVRGRGS